VEASALQAPAGLARRSVSLGLPLLRLRSDEQLVALFRDGNDEAFRAIHDRYRQRLFAYTRQMLPGSPQDAEDALQDVFVRAYAGLRASERELALRAWLYRVAHNRCIDVLRRPHALFYDLSEIGREAADPLVAAEQRDALRTLIADIRRLPEQQRSALLMRELSGMSYGDLAAALGISVPAVKSLLVRARMGLAKAAEARETTCHVIREELVLAHDRGVRPNGMARRHLRDCESCREFRHEVRGLTRQFAALTPALGPFGVLAKLAGIGSGGGAAAGGGAAVAGGAAGTGGVLAAGGLLTTGVSHVAALLAATVVTAGGAVEINNTIVGPAKHHPRHHHVAPAIPPRAPQLPLAQAAAAVSRAVTSEPVDVGASAAPSTASSSAAAPAEHARRAAATTAPATLDQGTFGLSGSRESNQDPTTSGSDGSTTGDGSTSGQSSSATAGTSGSSTGLLGKLLGSSKTGSGSSPSTSTAASTSGQASSASGLGTSAGSSSGTTNGSAATDGSGTSTSGGTSASSSTSGSQIASSSSASTSNPTS
jgi:RNA polymerase sigma factor (sigma-70 family)